MNIYTGKLLPAVCVRTFPTVRIILSFTESEDNTAYVYMHTHCVNIALLYFTSRLLAGDAPCICNYDKI